MSSGRRRARTSCWVIVDAPRSLDAGRVLGDGRDQGGTGRCRRCPRRCGPRRSSSHRGPGSGCRRSRRRAGAGPGTDRARPCRRGRRRSSVARMRARRGRSGRAGRMTARPAPIPTRSRRGRRPRARTSTTARGHGPETARARRRRRPTPDPFGAADRDDPRGPGHAGAPGRLGRPTDGEHGPMLRARW